MVSLSKVFNTLARSKTIKGFDDLVLLADRFIDSSDDVRSRVVEKVNEMLTEAKTSETQVSSPDLHEEV